MGDKLDAGDMIGLRIAERWRDVHLKSRQQGRRYQAELERQMLAASVTSTSASASALPAPSVDEILAIVDGYVPPLDPLNGAVELLAAGDVLDQARELAAAAGRPITVAKRDLLPPGCVIGIKPVEFGLPEIVVSIRPRDQAEGEGK